MKPKGLPKTGGRRKGYPKTGGRTKGTPNKVTTDIKLWLTEFITANFVLIEKSIEKLPERQKLELLLNFMPKVLPYILPKQSESSVNINQESYENFLESRRIINDLFGKMSITGS